MQVDAARCAAVGPSGLGAFERRSTHSVRNSLSIAQRRELAEELVFLFEAQSCLRRCEAHGVSVSGAFPTLVRGAGIAHLVCAVAEATRISSIREDSARDHDIGYSNAAFVTVCELAVNCRQNITHIPTQGLWHMHVEFDHNFCTVHVSKLL